MNNAIRFVFHWSGLKRMAGIAPIVVLVALGQWAIAGVAEELDVTGEVVGQQRGSATPLDEIMAEELDLGISNDLTPKAGFRCPPGWVWCGDRC